MSDETCGVCGLPERPEVPGVHLCSGMRPVSDEERKRIEFDPETRDRLIAFMDEADGCRGRAAVEARTAWIR